MDAFKIAAHDFRFPSTGATLDDYRREGTRFGEWRARVNWDLLKDCENRGLVLTEEFSDDALKGIVKDILDNERLLAKDPVLRANGKQVRAFSKAARAAILAFMRATIKAGEAPPPAAASD